MTYYISRVHQMRRLRSLTLVSIAILASEADAAPLGLPGIGSDLSFVEAQASKTLASLGSPTGSNYPRYGGETGTWTTVGASDWTSGFFPGELWLLYQATGSQQWLTAAQQWTAPLASQASSVTRVDPTDIGFIIGTSFGNGYRLTGDASYKSVLLTAGGSLASLYNSKVGAVRSWTFGPWQFPVIIGGSPQFQPAEPVLRDDRDDVGQAPPPGDAALLDEDQPQQARLTHRVLDGAAGATGQRGDGVDVQGADPRCADTGEPRPSAPPARPS